MNSLLPTIPSISIPNQTTPTAVARRKPICPHFKNAVKHFCIVAQFFHRIHRIEYQSVFVQRGENFPEQKKEEGKKGIQCSVERQRNGYESADKSSTKNSRWRNKRDRTVEKLGNSAVLLKLRWPGGNLKGCRRFPGRKSTKVGYTVYWIPGSSCPRNEKVET